MQRLRVFRVSEAWVQMLALLPNFRQVIELFPALLSSVLKHEQYVAASAS